MTFFKCHKKNFRKTNTIKKCENSSLQLLIPEKYEKKQLIGQSKASKVQSKFIVQTEKNKRKNQQLIIL